MASCWTAISREKAWPDAVKRRDQGATFLELEVVLRPDQSSSVGHEIAVELMRRLGIRESNLLATAYADMLNEDAAGIAAAPSPPPAPPTAS